MDGEAYIIEPLHIHSYLHTADESVAQAFQVAMYRAKDVINPPELVCGHPSHQKNNSKTTSRIIASSPSALRAHRSRSKSSSSSSDDAEREHERRLQRNRQSPHSLKLQAMRDQLGRAHHSNDKSALSPSSPLNSRSSRRSKPLPPPPIVKNNYKSPNKQPLRRYAAFPTPSASASDDTAMKPQTCSTTTYPGYAAQGNCPCNTSWSYGTYTYCNGECADPGGTSGTLTIRLSLVASLVFVSSGITLASLD